MINWFMVIIASVVAFLLGYNLASTINCAQLSKLLANEYARGIDRLFNTDDGEDDA